MDIGNRLTFDAGKQFNTFLAAILNYITISVNKEKPCGCNGFSIAS